MAGLPRNLRPILLLAVGAVIFTAFCIGLAARWLVPDLPWAAALALGAIVAPPDAVAAGAVLQRLRLPKRIVTVLEGESLINDASALVLYKLAVTAAMVSGGLGAAEGAVTFLACGAVARGRLGRRAGGDLGAEAPRRHHARDHRQLPRRLCELPGGEALQVSGVMAVVTTGLVFGRAQHTVFTYRAPERRTAVWGFMEFILNSLVFVLIGLQLNHILDRIAGRGVPELAGIALGIAGVLVAARFVWVFPATWLSRLIPAGGTIRCRPGAIRPSSPGPGCAGWSASPPRWPCRCDSPSATC